MPWSIIITARLENANVCEIISPLRDPGLNITCQTRAHRCIQLASHARHNSSRLLCSSRTARILIIEKPSKASHLRDPSAPTDTKRLRNNKRIYHKFDCKYQMKISGGVSCVSRLLSRSDIFAPNCIHFHCEIELKREKLYGRRLDKNLTGTFSIQRQLSLFSHVASTNTQL